jgi:replication fork clamp-binding protein CrfC
MTLRKAFAYIASQQLGIKLAALLAGIGIAAAFTAFDLTREHFVTSVIVMLVALLAAAISAKEALNAARDLKRTEQEHERRNSQDRRHPARC